MKSSHPILMGLCSAASITLVAGIVLSPSMSRAGAETEVVLSGPVLFNPQLSVRTNAEGLMTPIGMAFLDDNDYLVIEKNSGLVKRVQGGTTTGIALDLAVNFASERGLLGIALHPQFKTNGWVYLYWTESSTGSDSNVVSNVPLLGNRVDRFVWNGSTLTHDINVIRLRALQEDAGQPGRGNHNGGVIRFGPDQKLYILVGDVGRRGWLQNNLMGPTPDDQFGGPEPDNAHFTGVIIRLNDDGTTPEDNPFFGFVGGGEVGANIQRIFAYGIRNSFGLAFDPYSGNLWLQEHGDDTFDELSLVPPGMNSGWIQIMGPVERLNQYKEIETELPGGLQQLRWPPENIADSPEEALSRLFLLPGSHFRNPDLAWKYAVAPGGIGFVRGKGIGPQFEGDLFIGASRDFLLDGYLMRVKLTGNRRKLALDDPRLSDGVADNLDKHDATESESLLIGGGFGIVTEIQTGANGNLYLVSLSHGAVYEIFRRPKGKP